MKRKQNILKNSIIHFSFQQQYYVKIPTDILSGSDSMELNLELVSSEKEMVLSRNSRCVSVDTFLSAPEGRRVKKGVLRDTSKSVFKVMDLEVGF